MKTIKKRVTLMWRYLRKISIPIVKWLGSQLTFSKILVAVLVYKGIGWVDQSYALAWAGNIEIASDLSQKALVELLGVALLYGAKATFEQLSKHNTWPDKQKTCDTEIIENDQNGGDPPVG